jgi:hypothetical protein
MPANPAAHVAPTNCSALSVRLGEPLAGSAPVAAAWLAVEQPGPWGAKALTQSHLDGALGAELNRRAEGTGVRIALIRRVGHHVLPAAGAPRTVLLASTRPGTTAVHTLTVTDPRELLDLDLAALGAGRIEAGTPHPDPVLLVCTNGKRDRCCALLGRALALDLTERGLPAGTELWEADHLGGHRFAPTAVVLPTGYVYGRLSPEAALAAVQAAAHGQVATGHSRGRSAWSRPGQAADLALRAELQEFGADAVHVLDTRRGDDGRWVVDLSLPGADAAYRVVLEETPAAEPRPESCGKDAGNPAELRVLSLDKLP